MTNLKAIIENDSDYGDEVPEEPQTKQIIPDKLPAKSPADPIVGSSENCQTNIDQKLSSHEITTQ